MSARDWKRFPLTPAEARAMRQRHADERARDWQDFRQQWPMHLCEFLKDFGAGTLLGVALSLSLVLWVLSEVAA